MNDELLSSNNGLRHKECLETLFNEIDKELTDYRNKCLKFNVIARSYFRENSFEFTHNFIVIFICSTFLFILNTDGKIFQLANGLFLLMISILNSTILFYSFYKRSLVIYNNTKIVLKSIRDCIESNENWCENHFASLSLPNTLSISSQWVIREGKLLNLPINLIVSGDHIVLRPGHFVSVKCKSVEKSAKTGDYDYFMCGTKYEPIILDTKEVVDKYEFFHRSPIKKKIPESIKCIAIETPYIEILRSTLYNFKPDSDLVFINVVKTIHKYFICIIIPLLLFIQLLITSIHYFLFTSKDDKKPKIFINSLLKNILFSLIPLLPISYTIFYNLIKFHGIFTIYEIFKKFNQFNKPSLSANEEATSLLMQDTNESDEEKSQNKFSETEFNISADTRNATEPLIRDYRHSIETLMHTTKFKQTFQDYFLDIFSLLKSILFDCYNDHFNQNVSFIFSTNFIFGLGSLTNFSCVDKKGVLSWPNPTAESITLFKNNSESDFNSTADDLNNEETTNTSKNKEVINLETFNLTNDKTDGSRLHFDDANWHSNINLLKPLGLSILLNTCNKVTVDYYLKFSDLLKLEVDKHERLERASNEVYQLKSIGDRRCLCEVSHLMNFEENALNSYEIVSTSSLYRDSITSSAMRTQATVQKLQIPISNLLSVVAFYKHTGIHNMYCQGTADLVIDFCTYYWDGKQIKRLSYNQKKKLVDVFQRNSVTSYCTAFSYKPIINNEEKYWLEASKQMKDYSVKCSSVLNLNQSRDVYDSIESVNSIDFYETLSVDFDDSNKNFEEEEFDEAKITENIVELHSNQIFIGMVSMQYKAKIEVIKLIEKLTKSCIRFMHFSSDNEQISRVFGEALGLDVGWNCHISLADENSSNNEQNCSNQAQNDSFSNNLFKNKKIMNVDLKLNKKHGSLPNIKSSTVLYDNQTQTVKFDLSNIKSKTSNNILINGEESNEEESNDSDNFVRKPVFRQGSSFSKGSTDDFDRKKLLNRNKQNNKADDESSSHLTAHSGRTLTDSETLGSAVRLPKGINSIREHIEMVDNIPLHVSLFTDCTKSAINSMLEILKEHDEIVCCFGSSHSIENIKLFSEANLAIAIEPLYPQLCMKERVVQGRNKIDSKNSKIYPIDLSSLMNTISCGFSLKHDKLSLLPFVVSNARNLVYSYYICLIFMLYCCLFMSIMQIIGTTMHLPMIFSEFQLMWLLMFVIPVLSFSLINKNENDHLRYTKKNISCNQICKQDLLLFTKNFFVKFFPSVCLVIIMYCLTLYFKCRSDIKNHIQYEINRNRSFDSTTTTTTRLKCHQFLFDFMHIFNDKNLSSVYFDETYWSNTDSVYFSQSLNTFFVALYFIIISINYVYVEKSIWNYLPFKNIMWTVTIFIILFIQMVFTIVDVYQIKNFLVYLKSIPIIIWLIYFIIWPIIIIFFNEFTKVFEIKTTLRKYKKIRLEFDTKLGMNSPFV